MKKNEAEVYLQMYPKLLKWINECPACHAKGYNPNMPEHIGDEDLVAAGRNIRKMLRPLEVDDLGFCLTCSRLRKR